MIYKCTQWSAEAEYGAQEGRH